MSCKENKIARVRSGYNLSAVSNNFLSITTCYTQNNYNERSKTVLQNEHLSTWIKLI